MKKIDLRQIDNLIDLRDFLLKIWSGKWFLISFAILGLIASSIYILNTKEIYQSDIRFENLITFSSIKNKNYEYLKRLFHKKKYFDQWQEISGNKAISFQDIALSYQDKESNKVFLKEVKEYDFMEIGNINRQYVFTIQSDDFSRIAAYESYLHFLNSVIKREIVDKINTHKDSLYQYIKEFVLNNTSFSQWLKNNDPNLHIAASIYNFDKDLKALEFSDVFEFYPPTKPRLLLNKQIVLILGSVVGLTLGAFIFLLREIFIIR